jgi:hypothetical protein
MLVGEVREAMAGAGYSWKLSGGSQLSSGTDEVREVAPGAPGRRAQERPLLVAQVRGGRHSGRLIHQPTTGDSSHSNRTGAA